MAMLTPAVLKLMGLPLPSDMAASSTEGAVWRRTFSIGEENNILVLCRYHVELEEAGEERTELGRAKSEESKGGNESELHLDGWVVLFGLSEVE